MNGVGPYLTSDCNDVFDCQISFDWPLFWIKRVSLIGFKSVERQLVLLRVDRHCLDTEFTRRPKNTDGDLRSIGYEKLTNWCWVLWHYVRRTRYLLSSSATEAQPRKVIVRRTSV